MYRSCPLCKKVVCNGVGPSALPHLTFLLNSLPSSHIFREAADGHDLGYHLGFIEEARYRADRQFYIDMILAISKLPWYKRSWYRLQARRNYLFVRAFGRKFFNYKGCKGG